ncbi:hypothetical protein PR048_012549 [Dryococelus australis]|uniref:Fatty acyl-CoA reductase n=1 Tax=Dryococelus australis TaxID=614101 RepID=A0ABQ9HPP6_9NEOP|nr:hypothetical protein PR048_012549 [Dryococelus australis]
MAVCMCGGWVTRSVMIPGGQEGHFVITILLQLTFNVKRARDVYAVVTGAWKEPLPGWVENLNGPTGLMIGAGKGVIRSMHCNPHYCGDFMPVDVTANAIIGLAWKVANTSVIVENFSPVENVCLPLAGSGTRRSMRRTLALDNHTYLRPPAQLEEKHCTLARDGDEHLYTKKRLGKFKEAAGIAERHMEGATVCEAEFVSSSSHQTALGRARSAARLCSV